MELIDEPLSEHDDWIQRATFPEMYESDRIAELEAALKRAFSPAHATSARSAGAEGHGMISVAVVTAVIRFDFVSPSLNNACRCVYTIDIAHDSTHQFCEVPNIDMFQIFW